jgi:flagellar M-ring protein FliF
VAVLPASGGAAQVAHQPAQTGEEEADDAESRPEPLKIPKRESMIDISQIDGQVRESSIRKVGDVVTSHPEEAMAILRTWLHQPV